MVGSDFLMSDIQKLQDPTAGYPANSGADGLNNPRIHIVASNHDI